MKSEIVRIDNHQNGFFDAVKEAKKVAVYTELSRKNSLRLQLCTEELLSLARSVTGEDKAAFWIETSGSQFDLHVTAEADLDQEKRSLLLSVATSRKNEAAGSFIGKLRDMIEDMMAAEPNYNSDLPADALDDLANHVIVCTDPEWDGYEHSTLKKLANVIKVGIRGKTVDLTVSTKFA